ncbi:MAG: hypothetical protein NTZ72_13735 [Afipia sp.]|nr:hypothetical protein [Afipia sp.]
MVKKPIKPKKLKLPPVAPPSAKVLSEALLSSPIMDVTDWTSIVAVSLNFKEQLRNAAGSFEKLTEEISRNELVGFGNRLDRSIFGNSSTRFGVRIRRIVFLEKGDDRTWHSHLTLERPAQVVEVKFRQLVRESWNKSSWSVPSMDIQFSATAPWVTYSGKVRSKRAFISWTDAFVAEASVLEAKYRT